MICVIERISTGEEKGNRRIMKRQHYLAAELFGYSYANYEDHLGIGHVRFEKLMPQEALVLEEAERENWPNERVAQTLKMKPDEVADLRRCFEEGKAIVDAPNPAEAFRRGVRVSINRALDDGLDSPAAVEQLVVQICYRAADMAFLLDEQREKLSAYSEDLRREDDIEDEE
jgi:hypothetical protein